MNFQYYDTLINKSSEGLINYIKQITPSFTEGELLVILDDLSGEVSSKKKGTSKKSAYLEIGEDFGTIADITKLNLVQLKLLYQVFISKEINDKFAVKWRFYQNLKYLRDFYFESILTKHSGNLNEPIDFLVKIDQKRYTFIVCSYILDLEYYNNIIKNINEFANKENIIPEKLIIATNKTYRNLPITQDVDVKNIKIQPDLYVEWTDNKKPFNGDDLIIIINNESREKIAGFNFSSTQNLLDYVYENTNGGQISIFKQVGFFSEAVQESKPQIELIWKGIMIKENI